jgi:hypothetical protein
MGKRRPKRIVSLSVFTMLLIWATSSALAADWNVAMQVYLDEAALTPRPLIWGVKKGATDLHDPGLDELAPPSTPEGDDAYFASIVNQDSPFNKLLKDLREETGGSITWLLVLRTAPGKTIKLDWSAVKLPAGVTLGFQEADGKWNGVGSITGLSTGPKFLQWTNTSDQLLTKRLILHKY